jgi:superfamily II DNA helicase RecQ
VSWTCLEIRAHILATKLFLSQIAHTMACSLSKTIQEAETIARDRFGIQHLKDAQWEVIESVVYHRKNTIFHAPTGSGKSLTMQIPPLIKGSCGRKGIALIIMPLTLLLHEQASSTEGKGGAKYVDLDGPSNHASLRTKIAAGNFTHGSSTAPCKAG